jgi:hypothetical protein
MMMHASTRLLEQARQMIDASQFQNAEMVLDALIRVAPENVEAWKAYLWVRQNQTGLDWVKDRALKTQELSEAGKREILDFYLYLAEQLDNDKMTRFHSDASALDQRPAAEYVAEYPAVRFELLNTFDYSDRSSRRDAHSKPRRATYNFAVDIAGGVTRELSRHPVGKKIVAYIGKTGGLISGLASDPKRAYARLSESPHFEGVSGFVVLALILLGGRLAAADYGFGYVALGVSVLLSKWWLSKFWTPGIAAFNDQVRTYLQKSADKMPEIGMDAEDEERKQA